MYLLIWEIPEPTKWKLRMFMWGKNTVLFSLSQFRSGTAEKTFSPLSSSGFCKEQGNYWWCLYEMGFKNLRDTHHFRSSKNEKNNLFPHKCAEQRQAIAEFKYLIRTQMRMLTEKARKYCRAFLLYRKAWPAFSFFCWS